MFVISISSSAQKAYKPIKTALKAKNYNEAINQINKLKQDTTFCNDPKLYLFAIEANKGLNDAQNMKLYLKQKYDTIAFFSTTYQIVENALKIDSIENRKKEEVNKQKPSRTIIEHLREYMPNIHAAARFFYKKHNYTEANKYLRVCLDTPHSTIGELSQLPQNKDTVNAVLYTCAAYNLKDYKETSRYKELALKQETSKPTILKYLALSAYNLNDTTTYKKWLVEGWNTYPNNAFFFTHLIDFYTQNKQYNHTLSIAEKQLRADSLHVAAYLARSVVYYETQQYDSCIVNADCAIQTDSTTAYAYYYKGASYIGKVNNIEMPKKINSLPYKQALQKRQQLFMQAEPALETFRTLSPNDVQLWGKLLYDTYYALNRGKKFAEIESILAKHTKATSTKP